MEQENRTDSFVLRTPRLILRRMTQDDYPDLCCMLQDKDVMYAYEHAFSDEEAHEWLNRQLNRYDEYGFGLWAVVLKSSCKLIGQCGVTMQEAGPRTVPEIGYLFRKDCWHRGYATEAAAACKRYAFDALGFSEVYSVIRDNNFPSRRVAERNGMTVCGTLVKHYYGLDMPHLIYSAVREVPLSKNRTAASV